MAIDDYLITISKHKRKYNDKGILYDHTSIWRQCIALHEMHCVRSGDLSDVTYICLPTCQHNQGWQTLPLLWQMLLCFWTLKCLSCNVDISWKNIALQCNNNVSVNEFIGRICIRGYCLEIISEWVAFGSYTSNTINPYRLLVT